MTASLTLTAAGIAAIADGANVGLAAVTFTRLALGSGTGMGDQSARVALETQKDIVAVMGAAATPGRVAIRGDYMPSEAYAVTEVGLFAKVGAAGAEFLCAYWIAESDADAVAGCRSRHRSRHRRHRRGGLGRGRHRHRARGQHPDRRARRTSSTRASMRRSTSAASSSLQRSSKAAPGPTTSAPSPRSCSPGSSAITARRTWVLAEIAKIVDSAHQRTLNTLSEIAAALNNNANLGTALTDAISGRVRRAGDTMTGALNLVTPPDDDDSKKAVNSEWVRKNAAGGVGATAFFSLADGFQFCGSLDATGLVSGQAITARVGRLDTSHFPALGASPMSTGLSPPGSAVAFGSMVHRRLHTIPVRPVGVSNDQSHS